MTLKHQKLPFCITFFKVIYRHVVFNLQLCIVWDWSSCKWRLLWPALSITITLFSGMFGITQFLNHSSKSSAVVLVYDLKPDFARDPVKCRLSGSPSSCVGGQLSVVFWGAKKGKKGVKFVIPNMSVNFTICLLKHRESYGKKPSEATIYLCFVNSEQLVQSN